MMFFKYLKLNNITSFFGIPNTTYRHNRRIRFSFDSFSKTLVKLQNKYDLLFDSVCKLVLFPWVSLMDSYIFVNVRKVITE